MFKANAISLFGILLLAIGIQDVGAARVSASRFSCRGRVSGYYADIDTGCQVYHMCDSLGRQFSYSCPNTTLFQQRMLVCDHWYMVNCSKSEQNYDANLLIGQRDKPFVSEEDMQLRTPRPDILSVPPNNQYYDGLKEAESKYAVHPSNSIVGIADFISSSNDNDLAGAKQNYRPPSSWSTGIGTNKIDSNIFKEKKISSFNTDDQNQDQNRNIIQNTSEDDRFAQNPILRVNDLITEQDSVRAASQELNKSFKLTSNKIETTTRETVTAKQPTRDLIPPILPSFVNFKNSEKNTKPKKTFVDPVYEFIKRFDPESPDSFKTAFTKTEILNLNKELPIGQSSTEDERTPRKFKNIDSNRNRLQDDRKTVFKENRFNQVNIKEQPTEIPFLSNREKTIAKPDLELKPPRDEYVVISLTTMGPPIYYEWKWAAPALELELPNFENPLNITAKPQKRVLSGRRPFSDATRPPPKESEPERTDYNTSSYFIPDYVFPLDKPHPGYSSDNLKTSFQVELPSNGRSYGENPDCPQCHPAFLAPGTCEPCIVNR